MKNKLKEIGSLAKKIHPHKNVWHTFSRDVTMQAVQWTSRCMSYQNICYSKKRMILRNDDEDTLSSYKTILSKNM